MRILVVISGQKWLGGLAYQTALLCREWERLGHQVAVIAIGTDVVLDAFPCRRVRYDTRAPSAPPAPSIASRAAGSLAPTERLTERPYVFRYEVVADVARYAIGAPRPMRRMLEPLVRAGVALFAPTPPISPAREAITAVARAIGTAFDAKFRGGAAEGPLLTRLLLHTDPADVRRIDEIRAWFRPHVEYVCDLTLLPLMAHTRDRSVPLVAAAQGFEIVLRRNVPLAPALRAARRRVDALLSGSHQNLRDNVAPLAALVGPGAPAYVIPYGVGLDEGWDLDRAIAVRRLAALEPQIGARDRGAGGFWGPGGPPAHPLAPGAPFVITCYSRVDVEKGTDLALHALAILRDQGVPARLWIAGSTAASGPYLDVLRRKIRLLDLDDRVSLIGTLPDARDKVALLRASSVLAIGFIRTEPFGMVYSEAFACQLPVVAPATGAAPELMASTGETWTLYPKNDTGALARRLRRLYEQPEARARLAQQERRAFLERYNATAMAEAAAGVFEEAISARSGQHEPARRSMAA